MIKLNIPKALLMKHGIVEHSAVVEGLPFAQAKVGRPLVTRPTASDRPAAAPRAPSTASGSLPKAPLPASPPRTPTPRSKPEPGSAPKTQREPVTTWAEFERQHRETDGRLKHYLHMGRSRSVVLDRETATELDPAKARFLPANNLKARLRFAGIMAEHLDRAVGVLLPDEPVFFVTLIARRFTIREDRAAAFKVHPLHSWTHQILRGCSYVGMVEGAYYSNLDVTGAGYRRAVSWHIHAIVWGITEEQLRGICNAANRRYQTIVPGIDAAHYRAIERSEVEGQALYMSKGQLSDYRLIPRKREAVDAETGEVTTPTTGRFRQAKQDLRPGTAARLCKVFAGRTLGGLAFAGGGGRAVLKAIRHEAGADFRRWESQQAFLAAGSRQPRAR